MTMLRTYPFRHRALDLNTVLAVSSAGDFAFLNDEELAQLATNPQALSTLRQAELQSKYFLSRGPDEGAQRLLASRKAAKQKTVDSGPSLHIFVPTLQCAHSCSYCQVSRALDATGFSMTVQQIDAACDTIFESPSPTLTVEFQGGDPLIRFDLIKRAVERISLRNKSEKRNVRFVIASTLHQLTGSICEFLRAHNVYLSTSIDGPAQLHNRNRPTPTRDSHARTTEGIQLARAQIGPGSVSALMTTTRASLEYPEAIVDEYVRLGLNEIFIRPLSPYGFAKKNQERLGYSLDEFKIFYERALLRVLHWNKEGVPLREATAALILNKILSPFDAGYVDLQSPTGAGNAVLVYNYDGYVYPSDEARMLAETGDVSLRLGPIGTSIGGLLDTPLMRRMTEASQVRLTPGCDDCAFNTYCGPDPVASQGQFGHMEPPVHQTDHCRRHLWLFDFFFGELKRADEYFLDLAHQWARPDGGLDNSP